MARRSCGRRNENRRLRTQQSIAEILRSVSQMPDRSGPGCRRREVDLPIRGARKSRRRTIRPLLPIPRLQQVSPPERCRPSTRVRVPGLARRGRQRDRAPAVARGAGLLAARAAAARLLSWRARASRPRRAGERDRTESGPALTTTSPDARMPAGGGQREAGRRSARREPRHHASVRDGPLSSLRGPKPGPAPRPCLPAHARDAKVPLTRHRFGSSFNCVCEELAGQRTGREGFQR
jgi:hypothetical protein